jgi:hypothetical protein
MSEEIRDHEPKLAFVGCGLPTTHASGFDL